MTFSTFAGWPTLIIIQGNWVNHHSRHLQVSELACSYLRAFWWSLSIAAMLHSHLCTVLDKCHHHFEDGILSKGRSLSSLDCCCWPRWWWCLNWPLDTQCSYVKAQTNLAKKVVPCLFTILQLVVAMSGHWQHTAMPEGHYNTGLMW